MSYAKRLSRIIFQGFPAYPRIADHRLPVITDGTGSGRHSRYRGHRPVHHVHERNEPENVFGLICLVPVLLALLIIIEPYRMDRINAIFDPWNDPFDKGYQLTHALIAFGLGEWWGVGLGSSVEKLNYLPEAHTDFMFAVLAEELGFAGVVTVISLFFFAGAYFQSRPHSSQTGRSIRFTGCTGYRCLAGFTGFHQHGRQYGITPTKGLTLPFMSYGGSSIVINSIAIAILLRIDWENRLKRRGLNA